MGHMMRSRVRKFNKKGGFSLVELIVVIAILGMLMLLMVSNYGKFFRYTAFVRKINPDTKTAVAFFHKHLTIKPYDEVSGA